MLLITKHKNNNMFRKSRVNIYYRFSNVHHHFQMFHTFGHWDPSTHSARSARSILCTYWDNCQEMQLATLMPEFPKSVKDTCRKTTTGIDGRWPGIRQSGVRLRSRANDDD